MRKIRTIILLILCSLGLSCGTTKIITDKGIDATIYVNGVIQGKKTAEIKRMGFPKKIHVTAKYQGQIIGEISARRKMDVNTCVIGYFTYGIGLLAAWRFPEYIIIPVQDIDNKEDKWEIHEKNRWDSPINR